MTLTLDALLTHREPLGPIDQANVLTDADADQLLNERVTPFNEALSRMPILLLGRKGSGKSAILAEARLKSLSHHRAPLADTLPEPGEPFLIAINSWDHFHQLTRYVSMQYRDANPDFDSELVPTEILSGLWQEAIWDAILQHFYPYWHHRSARAHLAAVERYVVADGRFSGSPKDRARALFNEAKAAVIAYANARGSDIVLFIDSMEKYPVRNAIFADVLGGLMVAINKVHYETDRLRITFCLPEEIESHLLASSANIMKDYNAAYRIRWKPIDLLKVVAHRYRLFVKIRDEAFYASIKDINLDTREGVHDLFKQIMPQDFLNGMKQPEDPLAYITRHTQLLPRHMIAIFNSIVARSFEGTQQFRRLDQDAIRLGVLDAEKIVAQQVLVPFLRIYPNLIGACEDILPDLRPVCTGAELDKIKRRFTRRVEEDVSSVWRTLFSMGILGRVVPPMVGATEGSSRYCFAQFHYNIEGAFGLSTEAEYCFHPVFSRHFGLQRTDPNDLRAVYPAHVELMTLAT